MTTVKMCDEKKCNAIITADTQYDFELSTDMGSVTISLADSDTKDRCDVCVRKLHAKLARTAWDALKHKNNTRKEK